MTVADDIEALVKRKPGLTEAEIVTALFGSDEYQQRVNPLCRRLAKEGRVERRGRGGTGEPSTYYHGGAMQNATRT